AYGRWKTANLVTAWHRTVMKQSRFVAHRYEGFRPVACDLIGFYRLKLQDCPGKHYTSRANKALPAIVFCLIATVGSVDKSRLAIPRALVRQEPWETEVEFQRRMHVHLKTA